MLREQYLALVHELGDRKILGKTVVEYLQVRVGFSIWWMSSIAEKCNYAKTPYIEDIIRLMALQMYMRDFDLEHIIVESSDLLLITTLKDWCQRQRVKFTVVSTQLSAKNSRALLVKHTPKIILGLGWLLLRLVKRWPLKGQGLDRWLKSDGRYSFFSYFFNFDLASAQSSKFKSKYWGELPDLVSKEGKTSNWLHLYVENHFSSAKAAAKVLNKLNQNTDGQAHVTLDSFINLNVLVRVIIDWLQLRRRYKKTRDALSEVVCSNFNYWSYFDFDLAQSLLGHTAVSNLLHLALFEEACKSLSEQSIGVFLQENLPWEFAAIDSWKSSGHGILVGTPHTLIRFWDLRYYFDLRSYDNSKSCSIPYPDSVALNGPAAYQELLSAGYNRQGLCEVEALRYGYLEEVGRHKASYSVSPVLLVIGDSMPENTSFQLDLLAAAMPLVDKKFSVVYKAHPSCLLNIQKYTMLNMSVSGSSLNELLGTCDLVFTSSLTSGAIDAYSAGLPVISALDDSRLNLSPLRGLEGVDFVITPHGLAEKLMRFDRESRVDINRADIFWRDSDLSRWRAVLGFDCEDE